MRRVRVLQIIDLLGPGGAEMLIMTLAGGIDRVRFDLHVCALRAAPQFPHTQHLREMGVPMLELRQRNAYDLPALLAIMRYIRKHEIDVVHTHLLAADIMGRAAGFLTGRPVVSTIHNSRIDLDEEPARRRWLERVTARHMCRKLITVSEELREETAQWFGLPLRKVVAIPNGVDTSRYMGHPRLDPATKLELTGGVYPIAVNVGRMVPQKGQMHLLDAFQMVLKERPDARLVMLGDGEERAKLEARVRELGIEGGVLFTGYRGDVERVLAASEIFVLSSLWEGLPVALLEAMAAGCAPVATAVGGVPGVLHGEDTGLLVPPADPRALADALLMLFNDPERAARIGREAQSWVQKHYSMEAWIGKLERLYGRYAEGRQKLDDEGESRLAVGDGAEMPAALDRT
jgi:glycosyltransferase involved in cell wall biosynthesis